MSTNLELSWESLLRQIEVSRVNLFQRRQVCWDYHAIECVTITYLVLCFPINIFFVLFNVTNWTVMRSWNDNNENILRITSLGNILIISVCSCSCGGDDRSICSGTNSRSGWKLWLLTEGSSDNFRSGFTSCWTDFLRVIVYVCG